MARYTKFDNVEIEGKLNASGGIDGLGLSEDTYKITSDDAEEAAGSAPTAAEFAAVVTLLNEIKGSYNELIEALSK